MESMCWAGEIANEFRGQIISMHCICMFITMQAYTGTFNDGAVATLDSAI